jgi:hypothetical protein
MKTRTQSRLEFLTCVAIVFAAIVAAPTSLNAQVVTFTGIHDFVGTDGGFPIGNLIADSTGSLYGTTSVGGIQNKAGCDPDSPDFESYCGTVFKLSKDSGGAWTVTVLHEFTGGLDGGNPAGGLVFDAAGNLDIRRQLRICVWLWCGVRTVSNLDWSLG